MYEENRCTDWIIMYKMQLKILKAEATTPNILWRSTVLVWKDKTIMWMSQHSDSKESENIDSLNEIYIQKYVLIFMGTCLASDKKLVSFQIIVSNLNLKIDGLSWYFLHVLSTAFSCNCNKSSHLIRIEREKNKNWWCRPKKENATAWGIISLLNGKHIRGKDGGQSEIMEGSSLLCPDLKRVAAILFHLQDELLILMDTNDKGWNIETHLALTNGRLHRSDSIMQICMKISHHSPRMWLRFKGCTQCSAQ